MKYYIGQKVWVPVSLSHKTIVDIESFDNITLLYMDDSTAHPSNDVVIHDENYNGQQCLEEFLSYVIIRDILEKNSQSDLDNLLENTFGSIGKSNYQI